MEISTNYADKIISDSGNQLGKFFQHLIMEKGQKHMIPKFYGIPKIHKEPVKMWLIIPCHSAIQNPAAKYISRELGPLIQAAPTILKSTKDLAIKLSKINLDMNHQWFLITGDVIAFYPSIPLEKCLDIVANMYAAHIREVATMEELKEMCLFLLCLRTGNENLIMQYKDLAFKKTRGLAMGITDSPDLSNLYGLFFENTCNIHQHLLVPFYRRFINNIFDIVYASSEAEAINIMNIVKFNDCVIAWGMSDLFLPFLDMTIYHDVDNRLQHMLYRKVRSHQERIPWISHHPLDVKKRNCNW